MIRLKLKAKCFVDSLEVKKYIDTCEKAMNKEFPPERLDAMRTEIWEDVMVFGGHMRDENNVRVPPERWPEIDDGMIKKRITL